MHVSTAPKWFIKNSNGERLLSARKVAPFLIWDRCEAMLLDNEQLMKVLSHILTHHDEPLLDVITLERAL
jgi:hypothetical protein